MITEQSSCKKIAPRKVIAHLTCTTFLCFIYNNIHLPIDKAFVILIMALHQSRKTNLQITFYMHLVLDNENFICQPDLLIIWADIQIEKSIKTFSRHPIYNMHTNKDLYQARN